MVKLYRRVDYDNLADCPPGQAYLGR